MSEWQVDENKAWFKKWWPQGTPKNHQFEKISLGEFFERQRKKYADEKLMWFIESWMTYEKTGKAIDFLFLKILNNGTASGSIFTYLCQESTQVLAIFFISGVSSSKLKSMAKLLILFS